MFLFLQITWNYDKMTRKNIWLISIFGLEDFEIYVELTKFLENTNRFSWKVAIELYGSDENVNRTKE